MQVLVHSELVAVKLAQDRFTNFYGFPRILPRAIWEARGSVCKWHVRILQRLPTYNQIHLGKNLAGNFRPHHFYSLQTFGIFINYLLILSLSVSIIFLPLLLMNHYQRKHTEVTHIAQIVGTIKSGGAYDVTTSNQWECTWDVSYSWMHNYLYNLFGIVNLPISKTKTPFSLW